MNYQTKPKIASAQAAELLTAAYSPNPVRLGFCEDVLEYYAWPQTFGCTTGPFGGIGGSSMTTFTIEAWAIGRFAVLFCGDRVIRCVDNFRPLMHV